MPETPAQTGTSVPLADALRSLADAGLPPEALAAAVEALMRAARPAPATAPRLVGVA